MRLLALALLLGPLFCNRARAQAVLPAAPYSVGMTQVQFSDSATGGRSLNFMLIYPAAPQAHCRGRFTSFCLPTLHLYKNAPPVKSTACRHPLVIFSHGAGGNGSVYAWFGQYLTEHAATSLR